MNGTLSRQGIIDAYRNGSIIIDPFDLSKVGPNSYDVTLGEFIYREQSPGTQHSIMNPYDKDSIRRVWGALPDVAVPYSKLVRNGILPSNMKSYHPDDKIIMIAPGETILAHTEEFIGGNVDKSTLVSVPLDIYLSGYTTKMHSRSSIGRIMLGVCKCSGFGDVGFINRWTMEITSFSKYWHIPLVVGRPIAQIEFVGVNNITSESLYTSRSSSKYQMDEDIDKIKSLWRPSMMLPRLDKESYV